MLERLITAEDVSNKPVSILLLGILYSSFAILVSLIIFPSEPAIAMIFLTTILCMPLLYRFAVMEEDREIKEMYRRRFKIVGQQLRYLFSKAITAHSRIILLFLLMFVGFIIAYTLWYTILPPSMSQTLFSSQKSAITAVNVEIHGRAVSDDIFTGILMNNMRVLVFSFVLSFLFGAGALFVLAWNSSVISVAIGELLIKNLSIQKLTIIAALVSFSRYLIHGIPELVAYLIAMIAGLFISLGVIRFDINSREFKRMLIASVDLIILSLIILIFAAVIEVSISPLLMA
jgi:uncharacterized membrane protein SpoIIM required for sporulation